jgi:signal transduction histidine kinase
LTFKALSDQLANLLVKDNKKNWPGIAFIFIIILLPVTFLGALTYLRMREELTTFALSQRQAIAYLAATTLKEKLDRLTDVSVSLASRVKFRQLVNERKWDEAVQILKSVPNDFPFVDRLFLSDLDGTLWADTPALPNVRGKNFAERDWYLGVSQNWKPYVSGVYKRAAEPRYNVFAVAAPIKAEDGSLAGILVLQVKVDFLLQWTTSIEVGPNGFVVIVDRQGKIASHPKHPPQGELLDYSRISGVQDLLSGDKNADHLSDTAFGIEGKIVIYQSVPGYSWRAIVEQPMRDAFAAREENLKRLLSAYAVIGLISCALAYLILRFLTERRQAENEIRKLNKHLAERSLEVEAANKELEAFSYSVSHDLRAPLRAVDGFSRIVLEDYASELSEEGRGFLNRVRENAINMGQLIDDLLAFSRLGRQPLKKESIVTTELARQVLDELKQEQNGRRIKASVADLPNCMGDPKLLKQVFVNLLSNALKYTRKCEVVHIKVGWEQINGEPVYFVKDNGAGFDMKYADKLFGVFQRLHRSEEYEGTGVGLAIVQRVINRHGGRIWAEAVIDNGANFYFTLGGGQNHV